MPTSFLALILTAFCPCGESCSCGTNAAHAARDTPSPRFVRVGPTGSVDAAQILSAHPAEGNPTTAQVLFRGGHRDEISDVTAEQWEALLAALPPKDGAGDPKPPPI